MSLTFVAPCPRCEEAHSMFQVIYSDTPVGGQSDVRLRQALARCNHCLKFVVLDVFARANTALVGSGAPVGDISKFSADVRIEAILPKMPQPVAPDHVPEKVASAYTEGLKILQQRMWTPAASSFRTCLDRATKLLWMDSQKNEAWPDKLSPRIQELKEKLGLPKAIADWAHQVRIVGNEIHDLDDVVEEDARDVGHFTELFLTYTFTLPKRLEAFRERRAQADGE